MRDEQSTYKIKNSKIGKILLILFVITAIAGTICCYFITLHSENLARHMSEFKIRSEETIQFEKAGVKGRRLLSIAIAPDKENIVYSVSSDGTLFVSHDSGKSFNKVADTGITITWNTPIPHSKIIASENGFSYILVRNSNRSILGIGQNYGKMWKFKKVDFAISDIFTVDNPERLYFSSAPSYNSNTKTYGYVWCYDFAKQKFINVSGQDPSVFFLWDDPVFPMRFHNGKVFFSFYDATGRFASEALHAEDSGNPALSKTSLRGKIFKAYLLSEIKDFCEVSDDKFVVATNSGLYFLNLKHKSIDPINTIITSPDGVLLHNMKNIFLHPLKLIFDKNHGIVYMLTRYGGVFGGKFIGKRFYWFNLTSYVVSGKDISDKEGPCLYLRRRYTNMTFPYFGFPNHQPTVCYDFDISQNPYYIMVSTNKGLVKISLKVPNVKSSRSEKFFRTKR